MLQNQLSMKTGVQTQIPPYFLSQKQKFLDQAQSMGFDVFAVQDFIEEKGLYEHQIQILLDQLNNPAYINPLKRGQISYQPSIQGGFMP